MVLEDGLFPSVIDAFQLTDYFQKKTESFQYEGTLFLYDFKRIINYRQNWL